MKRVTDRCSAASARILFPTLLLCLIPATSGAVMMRVSFEGVVTNSAVFTDPFGFGTGSGVLNGRTITGSFFYETDLAPPDTDVDPASVYHGTTSNSEAWFSTPEVFIDGVPVPVPSFDLFANYLDTDFALVGLKDEISGGVDVVEYSRELFQFFNGSNIHSFALDVSVSSFGTGANIIDSLLLTEPYGVTDFTDLDSFGSNISSRRTDGGLTSYEFFADFELTNALGAEEVPEPTIPVLLGGGVLGLVPMGRRHRR